MVTSPIEEIKNRLDIVEVIGSYLKLQKTGANFRALCPFHSEKKPSFFVSPARQIWHCFGCGAGGDLFRFVMQIEGIEFADALRILAQRAGVELKPVKPELKTERQRLSEICQLATRFFEKQLEASKTGQEVKKYLFQRGISEESIKKWRLGYSPESWQGLTDFLVSKGYKREEIEKAGLAIKSEQGSFYDRFRGRIIFPIFDLNSNVIGFGGRVFKEDKEIVAKYINTPNTLLYDKSRILYGLDKAKLAIRQKDSCILVEGYTDVIMAHQVGHQNVVATSGTGLTSYQLKILKRYSENLILAFDMDLAGDSATKRGIDLAQSLGFNIKITRLAEGKDAAEIISKNPELWSKALEDSKSILEFYFQSAFSSYDSRLPEGKREISKILLPVIKRIPNQIEKSFWIQKLAKELEVREEDILQELRKIELKELDDKKEESEIIYQKPKTRKELLEESLISQILRSPSRIALVADEKIVFFSKKSQEILTALKKERDLEKLTKKFSNEALDYFNYLLLKKDWEDLELGEPSEMGEKEFSLYLKEISYLSLREKLDQVSKEIKIAEKEGDSERIKTLSQEFNRLLKEIKTEKI